RLDHRRALARRVGHVRRVRRVGPRRFRIACILQGFLRPVRRRRGQPQVRRRRRRARRGRRARGDVVRPLRDAPARVDRGPARRGEVLMRRALLVVLGAALVSCGLVVGSTQNYAGSFCRDLDVATVVCNSFDDPDGGSAGWTTPPTDGSPNAISLTTPEAPVAAPWSRPRLLRIDTGSGAPLDRWRIFIEDSGAPVTCELDGVI